jgi:hypothetical protein
MIELIRSENQINPKKKADRKHWRVFNQRMTALIAAAEVQGKEKRIDRLLQHLAYKQRQLLRGRRR